MKTTGTRSLILYILTFGFLFGLGFFLLSFYQDGAQWALQPYNRHLAAGGRLSYAGKIIDRDGTVLAYSEKGERLYNKDEQIRRSTLHVVGDTNAYISTGIQYNYQAQLSGYNMFTGLAAPTGESTGSDMKLTISSKLSKLALQKFGSRKGAAVLYNYKTGEILCMVSSPTFDPGNVPKDLNTDQTGKYDGVYLNRALSSSYTPGSIFKLVTTAAAIESIPDLDERTFTCKGSVAVNGEKINCTAKHGKQSFAEALANSCNVVFAELAIELGKDKLTQQAEKMGFNQSFYLDGIPSAKSSFDVTGADDNGLAWSGIGQYKDLTNPYHMALLMGSIAAGGSGAQPYLIQNITTNWGLPSHTAHTSTVKELVQPETAARLKVYMRNNVTSEYGDSLFPGLAVCAKTGTAEVGKGKKPNGWMVGFSSQEATPIAFAVVVENTNSGIGSAGQIASALMQAAVAD